MKKIILKILLFLNICTIIFSKCEEDNKSSVDDCAPLNDKGKYPDLCCFYKEHGADNTIKGKCKTVPYSSYYEGYNREYIADENILYDVTCKQNPGSSIKTYTLERCGNTYSGNPSKKECKKYSTFVDSCCYYSGEKKEDDPSIDGAKFEKGCYWLGSKYEGSIFWAGARLECSNNFLKYSLFVMLYIIILL